MKEFLVVLSQNTQTYYRLNTEETLIEISVTPQSVISEYLFPLHSFIPTMFLEQHHRLRVLYASHKNCRA